MQVTRRHVTLAAAGALTMLPLAACADDEAASSSPTSPAERVREPVSIEHANGTATFETVPTRIVAFSSQWIDALLALGVTPVGYLGSATGADERDLFPWESGLSTDARQLPVSAEGTVPIEQIAALTPDLVLGDWSVTAEVHPRLAAVAPTIAMIGDGDVDTWEDQLAVLGQILRREDDAQAVVDEANAAIDAVAAAHPGVRGRTFALSQHVFTTQQLVVVADPDDGSSQLFARLGMQLPPALLAEAEQGRIIVSPEQVDLLTADLVVFLPNGGTEADISALPGWTDLPSVKSGGMVYVDYATVVGFNTPSALSVQAVLQTIEAGLAAVESA